MDVHAQQMQAAAQIAAASSLKDLEALHIQWLGRKGTIQGLMAALREAPADQKKVLGQQINTLKQFVEEQIEARKLEVSSQELNVRLEKEKIDLTLPGRQLFAGHRHPVLATLDRATTVFEEMGFAVQLAPDLESDYYNFEGLNYPPDHPARDMQDTFWVTDELLLRTHNTSIQLRAMEKAKPPIRIVCPGKCFRNEEISARSHVFFHQIDGLYIDKNVTLVDLISTMQTFYRRLLGDVELRFRPSYFPFVEPGLEIDATCLLCKGSGCAVCKQSGWLEVCGAGLVHPQVLRNGGIDPEEYSGYAFGMGIERLVMLLHGIPDIRLFTQNNLQFLHQFP